MKRTVATLVALGAAFGLSLASTAPAHAGTNYKSTSCSVENGITMNVTSWHNSNGTRTWHYSATKGPKYVNISWAPDATFTLYWTKNGRTQIMGTSGEGYYTSANKADIVWQSSWKKDPTSGFTTTVYCQRSN